jgi:EAL domain-containing protein (putative c-di-GMP-specific phosphodiesterase class I)
LLREERLVSHFQPIVQCSSGTEIFGYECLIRGQREDGTLIPPEWLYHAARGLGMLFQLDRSARLKHIQTVTELGLKSHIFINFNPVAIYDAVFCLKSTVNAIDGSGLERDHFVFEVVESDNVADCDRLLEILDFYRHQGFAVALDDVGAGYNSLNLLAKLRPDYIKLDIQLIRNVDRDEYKAQIAGKLLEMAASLGVATVAEGIETEGEWQWTREHGADYCQGFLFATPAQVPPASVSPGGTLKARVGV